MTTRTYILIIQCISPFSKLKYFNFENPHIHTNTPTWNRQHGIANMESPTHAPLTPYAFATPDVYHSIIPSFHHSVDKINEMQEINEIYVGHVCFAIYRPICPPHLLNQYK